MFPLPLAPNGQPLASFGDRFLAFLIDYLIMAAIGLALATPLMLVAFIVIMPQIFDVAPDGSLAEPNFLTIFLPLMGLQFAVLIVVLGGYYVYHVEMMFRTGQTVGKRVMKLRIVPLNPAGAMDRPTAAKRFLVQHVAANFLPFFAYVDGLWQLWDKPYQQCLHDKFARTVVVKVPG